MDTKSAVSRLQFLVRPQIKLNLTTLTLCFFSCFQPTELYFSFIDRAFLPVSSHGGRERDRSDAAFMKTLISLIRAPFL